MDKDHGEVILSKVFDDQQEALDYIGLKNYEIQYFPYENYEASVCGMATISRGDKVGGMNIYSCNIDRKSVV